MSNLSGWDWLIYFLSILAVVILINLTVGKLSAKRILWKKIAWAVLMVSAMYWAITFSFISSVTDFHTEDQQTTELSSSPESKAIEENRTRIKNLERNLRETQENLQEIRTRFYLLLQIGMYAVIFYGSNRIFNSKKNLGEADSENL